MSVRKHSVLTTSDIDAPAASSCVATLAIVWVVWALTPPSTIVSSFILPLPDTMMRSPARTNGLYGPSGLFIGRNLAGGGQALPPAPSLRRGPTRWTPPPA